MIPFPQKRYDIVYADPPWFYDTVYTASAASHYKLMTDEQIFRLPVRSIMHEQAALFLWATCPRLDIAIQTIYKWGLYYRGVAYIWIKTNKSHKAIIGKGIAPTFIKPMVEIVLVATTMKKGRPFPILTLKQQQVIPARVGQHSAKPGIFRKLIVDLCGDRSRIELFARTSSPGWDSWGLEAHENNHIRRIE